MTIVVRDATPADRPAIHALLPRLAAFAVPAHRTPSHLWEGDAALLDAWARGEAPQVIVQVAIVDAAVAGATISSVRPEPLSHAPSAHLEVLVVAEAATGRGVGQALLAAMETAVRARGAQSVTLHVFAANARARALYERCGYDGEILRYYKPL